MKERNIFQAQRRKRNILNGLTSTAEETAKAAAHNGKQSAIETLTDLAIGVVGGGLAGAAIGKPALLVGLAISGIGHYTNNRLATTFGLGIMASGTFSKTGVMNGTGIDGMKERVMAFKDDFLEKTYLNKIIKPKAKETAVTGLGEVQYFSYPTITKGIDFSSLNNLENTIANSGKSYNNAVNGNVFGIEEDPIY